MRTLDENKANLEDEKKAVEERGIEKREQTGDTIRFILDAYATAKPSVVKARR